MPASKSSHVLAIHRRTLRLNQADLARLAGCSVSTIQSVELGRLQLSQGLAARISLGTGVDGQWLFANNSSVPIPERLYFSKGVSSAGLQEHVNTICLLADVFSRLFAVARKLDKTRARDELELIIASELDTFKKSGTDRKAKPLNPTNKEVFQYFAEYPGSLNEELNNLLDIDHLIQTSLPEAQLLAEEQKEKTLKRKASSRTRGRKAPSRTRQ
jgi:transcriptional regulator with XRE-family HTH domain